MTQLKVTVQCQCGRGSYDAAKYHACYECYLDRRKDFLSCIFCGRLHSPNYPTCFECRTKPDAVERAGDLKFEILMRDEFSCQTCGSNDGLRVNHIVSCDDGGNSMPWNLRTLCQPCDRQAKDVDVGDLDVRKRLMHMYFTIGWKMLEPVERQELIEEASEYKREFRWHSHFHGKKRKPPQWAIERADEDG